MLDRFAEIERQYQLVKRVIEKYGKDECDRILKPVGRAGWVNRKELEELARDA